MIGWLSETVVAENVGAEIASRTAVAVVQPDAACSCRALGPAVKLIAPALVEFETIRRVSSNAGGDVCVAGCRSSRSRRHSPPNARKQTSEVVPLGKVYCELYWASADSPLPPAPPWEPFPPFPPAPPVAVAALLPPFPVLAPASWPAPPAPPAPPWPVPRALPPLPPAPPVPMAVLLVALSATALTGPPIRAKPPWMFPGHFPGHFHQFRLAAAGCGGHIAGARALGFAWAMVMGEALWPFVGGFPLVPFAPRRSSHCDDGCKS